ncbi:MAG: hypothetical protein QM658_05085 [Gordonia sp. (in: high G+C Gram-positive bacteria)]
MAKTSDSPDETEQIDVDDAPQGESGGAEDQVDDAEDQADGHVSPLDRDDFLAANRRNREALRAKEDAKKAKKDDSAPAADPSRVPGKVASTPARRSVSRQPLVLVLGALVVVLAIATGVLGYLYASDSDDGLSPGSGIGRQALTTAKDSSVAILSYSYGDYTGLDRKIRSISTSDFADRYITSSQEARKGNDAAKATSKATAVDAGLISITDSKAVVLVALNQTVTSPDLTAENGGILNQSRVKLTLTRDGDRWLVSDLETV